MSTCLSINIQDWMANFGLRMCSHHERGVWLDVLCLMHKSETVGVLNWPLSQIAKATGSDVETLISLVNKGVLKGKCADGGEQVHRRQDLPLTFARAHARREGGQVVLIEQSAGDVWYCDWMAIAWHKSKTSSAASQAGTKQRLRQMRNTAETGEPEFQLNGNESASSAAKCRVSRTPECPYEEIVERFRTRFPNAPKPRALNSSSRLGKAIYGMWRARSKGKDDEFSGYDTPEQGIQKWEKIFDLAKQSKFLRGEAPPRQGGEPFRISIDWFMTPTQVERVLNGFYDRQEQRKSIATTVQASAARLAEMVASRHGGQAVPPVPKTPAQTSIF